ncbi:MAG: PEP-CTERM sorting domain-containing protein [Acidobacteriaceae bacterium]
MGSDAYLSQILATTSGSVYQVSFELSNGLGGGGSGGTPNDFSANFGASQLTSFVNANPFDFTTFTYNITAASNDTQLQFAFRQDPSAWFLTNVSVIEEGGAPPVPEPSSLILLSTGLLGAAGALRRKFVS